MTTLSSTRTPGTADARETVGTLRELLAGLGAEDELLRRVLLRQDLGGRTYVSVPPLPADLAARLARLQPGPVAA